MFTSTLKVEAHKISSVPPLCPRTFFMTEIVELPGQNEWRFEVSFKNKATIKLIQGNAELFGTELAPGQEYEFSGQNVAIYSWFGCKIEYSGEISEYTSENTPMPVYANAHFALENLRRSFEEDKSNIDKPSTSILILGPPSSGKSTLAKILTAYALKCGHTPLVVNLDPKAGVFTPPGGLSANIVTDILDIENGWGSSAINGPSPIRPKQPLLHYYGLESPKQNERYYKHVLSCLSLGINGKLSHDPKIRRSGLIIDSPPELADSKSGYSLVSRAVIDFNINAIAVIGDERMYSELTRRFKEKFPQVAIIKLPRSGGIVLDDDHSFLRQQQHAAIQQYFYGTARQVLSPFTLTVKAHELTVWRVLEGSKLSDTTLTSGNEEFVDSTPEFLTKIEPSSVLQNCVMAIVNADPSDPPSVLVDAEVLGYVYVVEADDNKKTIKILMPLPGRLPNRPFILGDFRYLE